MSKKKILTIAISVALVAILVVGASLAYFTDTKEATNTFTVGGVKIELLEQQRAHDNEGNLTTTLENFEQDKLLMPIVGSAQGEKDALGM
ncbi:MAG: SipW-dependent-type signal peptide-containing protein, partial [Oscillospiraceae bacterium]|nr:SipW-dependent-type signal peptide-containing protein [Oscillospiraceae bacterium]